ncbi:hypothetical protein PHLGIDRAFT_23270 [Phlebiopsis gigantea 11061_1 CR5-6]|uniref:Calcineurin-like phosphoesterase domain-containing protein n=1 Tax=Phlebiopsis gigantea (strain 11061_1 CR5-6) TaxID=745531 RepID=A0A0C3NU84_PHLG1|nr:hypothetical protein PHLGIDRAFT_23270 [Phlebiopsis gigantea 11061_1 CR5-6]
MSQEDTYSSPTAYVYTRYDIDKPPPHPGKEWTRFICISDTHSRRYKVPNGDVLLHSGDLSSWGYAPQIETTIKWLEGLPHPVKIVIAGNHDLAMDLKCATDEQWAAQSGGLLPLKEVEGARARIHSESAKKAGIHYLEYESMSFTTNSGRTWEVYGSPGTPKYALGAFQYRSHSEEAVEVHSHIPPTTEILLTHTPPFGTCDRTRKDKHAGCPALAARLDSGKLMACKLHIFGHIHEAFGIAVKPADDSCCERISVNAAMPDSSLATIVDLLND